MTTDNEAPIFDLTPPSSRPYTPQVPRVDAVSSDPSLQQHILGEVVSVDVALDTQEEAELFEQEYGRLLTKQLLRNLRSEAGLSLQDVATRRQVSRASIQTLEGQNIAAIQVGTLVKQLRAIGHTNFTETVLVKLILEFLKAPPGEGPAAMVDASKSELESTL